MFWLHNYSGLLGFKVQLEVGLDAATGEDEGDGEGDGHGERRPSAVRNVSG